MARRTSAHTMVVSRRVPKTPGPTVHAVRVQQPGPTLYVAQLLPLEAPLGKPCTGPIRKQADLLFGHLRQVVMEAGFKLDEVAQLTLYVTSLKHMDIIDELYTKLFVSLALPARSIVCVAALPHDLLVALDARAVQPATPMALPELPQMPDMNEEMY